AGSRATRSNAPVIPTSSIWAPRRGWRRPLLPRLSAAVSYDGPVTMRGEAGNKKRAGSGDWEDPSFDLWQVQGCSDLRLVTLDELDAAFKRDEVTSRTLVRRPGSGHWRTLAEVAGIEESSPEIAPGIGDDIGDDIGESLAPVSSEIEIVEL